MVTGETMVNERICHLFILRNRRVVESVKKVNPENFMFIIFF